MAQIEEFILKLRDQFSGSLKSFDSGMSRARASVAKTKSSIMSLGGVAATAFAGIGVQQLGQQIISATERFDALRASIMFSSGSVAEGNKNLNFVRQTAKDLKLDLFAAAEGFNILNNATIGTNFASEDARKLFLGVAKGLRVAQVGVEDQKGAFRALGQIMSKGKLQAEELRLQLGDRLPGAFGIAARAMNITTSQLDQMLKDGKLLAEDFLPKFAAELNRTFGAGVQGATTTLNANLVEMNNQFTELKIALGNEFKPEIKAVVRFIVDMVKKIRENIDFIGKWARSIGRMIVTFVKLKATIFLIGKSVVIYNRALMLLKLATMSTAVQTRVLTMNMRALTVAMSTNPFGLLLTAASALVAFLAEIGTRVDEINKDLEEKTIRTISRIDTQISKLGVTVKQTTKITKLFRQALKGDIGAEFNVKDLILGLKKAKERLQRLEKSTITPTGEVEAAKKTILRLQEELKKRKILEDKDKKGKKGKKGLKSGISEVRARAPKTFNINIENLVDDLTFNTSTLNESTGKIKEEVVKVLLTAINDAQVIAR